MAVRKINKAFKQLKRPHTMQNFIKCKKAGAMVRRTVRQATRASWNTFCDNIGRTTPVKKIWGMIKRMSRIRRQWDYPLLELEEETAVSNNEQAELMAKTFA